MTASQELTSPRNLISGAIPSNLADYLSSLNDQQYRAVTAPVKGGTRIYGGAGEGTTTTLLARATYLILEEKLDAAQVVVLTSTSKAAEKLQLTPLKDIDVKMQDLTIATFHGVCGSYLHKNYVLASLPQNFEVCNRQISARIVRDLPSFRRGADFNMTAVKVSDTISKAKNHKKTIQLFQSDTTNEFDDEQREWIAEVWTDYQEQLNSRDDLDYDDLLIQAIQLFTTHPEVLDDIQSVLVNSFQNTTLLQFEVAKLFAKSSNSMTVVGDPEQSIYSWSNAKVEWFDQMARDFLPNRTKWLEKNYRSSNSILQVASTIIHEETPILKRSLYSDLPFGMPVILHEAAKRRDEATFIVESIQSLSRDLGPLIKNNDFAILLRAKYMAFSIQLALFKAGIPSEFRGKYEFFRSREIKVIVLFIRLLADPSDVDSLKQLLTLGCPTLRKKTNSLLETAYANGKTLLDACWSIGNGGAREFELSGDEVDALNEVTRVIRRALRRLGKSNDLESLIGWLSRHTWYRAYLSSVGSIPAAQEAQNLEDLKTFARFVEPGAELQDDAGKRTAHLTAFVKVMDLAAESDTQLVPRYTKEERVVLSTIHSAVDVDWPVVFVPAVEEGVFPDYRATSVEQFEEERRLLYVAVARARACCILSFVQPPPKTNNPVHTLSPFLVQLPRSLFSAAIPDVTREVMTDVSRILDRPMPVLTEQAQGEAPDAALAISSSPTTSTFEKGDQPPSPPSRPAKKRKQ